MSLLGIICAMDSELAPILRNMEFKQPHKSRYDLYQGYCTASESLLW